MKLSGFILCIGVGAVFSQGYNSRETDISGEAVKEVIEDITKECFSSQIQGSWDVYHYQDLDCTSIRKVLSIVPSCEQCTGPMVGSFSWSECFNMQKLACSQSQYCSTYCTCAKTGSATNVLPQNPTSASNSQGTSEATYSSGDRHGHQVEETDCGQTVPVAMAAGLFVAGLLIGAIVTAFMCVCVPCCERKSTAIRTKMTKQSPDTGTSQLATEASGQGNEDSMRAISMESPSYQIYQPLSANHTETHPYTRSHDHGMIYTEPIGGRGSYEHAAHQPIRSPRTVQSPVYNQFKQEDVIPGTKAPLHGTTSCPYQELDHTLGPDSHHRYGTINSNDNPEQQSNKHQPIRTSDANDPTNHNYLILEPESSTVNTDNAMGQPGTDGHQYFVLEADSNPIPGTSALGDTDNSETCQQKKHEYFVLEKTS